MGGGTEQDYYEFERLLGEIPDVTSGNPHVDESATLSSFSVLKGRAQDEKSRGSSSPASLTNFYHVPQTGSPCGSALYDHLTLQRPNDTCLNSSEGSFNHKIQANGNLDGRNVTVVNGYQSPIKIGNYKESNLLDEQSLASAFTQMSFNDGMAVGATSPHTANDIPLTKCTSLLEEKYLNNLRKSHSSLASPRSPSALNGTTLMSPRIDAVEKFDMNLNIQESEKFHKCDVQEPKKHQNCYCHPVGNLSGVLGEQRPYLPIYSAGTPLAPTMHSFQVLPSFPVPGVEFPVASYQQQYFFDGQSPVPYVQPQQISRSHIPWQHMEHEQYNRMQQQYQFMQQLRDQGPQTHHPIQANMNMTIGPMARAPKQPCQGMPIPHQVEPINKDSPWNNASVQRELNPSEFALLRNSQCRYYAQGLCWRGERCPFGHGQKQTSDRNFDGSTLCNKEFESVQFFDKVGKNNFPEKILTRSHGLNFLKVINPSSIGGNESLRGFNGNGSMLSNDHFQHKSSYLNVGSLTVDGQSSRGSSPDSIELTINNQLIQPQKYNSVDEVRGRIYLMAKDQHGCRFLQRKFTEGSAEDVDKIFVEIIGHIVELMTDPFGNYLVQKLLEVCNEDQRMQILHTITRKPGDLVRISLDMHGTRAVQKVIETLAAPEQYSMVVSLLKPGIVTLMKDTNGNHVAQRCLQHLMPEYNEFLFEAAIAHCNKLAKDRHGCCVLQKCLTQCDDEHRCRLVCGVTSNALNLSQNQYGNYVVQYVFELQLPWATIDILDKLKGSFALLSMQKYSSNVVEKCLKRTGEEHRHQIVKELIDDTWLDQILHDPYGNYVVQAALNHCKGTSHATLVEAIRPHISALKTSPFGKKILSSNSLKK